MMTHRRGASGEQHGRYRRWFLHNDPGGCTLREAVNAANSDPDTNTITFNIPLLDPGCNGGAGPCTITLVSGN